MNHEFSKALDENKEIRIVFCYITRAFDRVWHKGLLFKLHSIGVSENILGCLKIIYLTDNNVSALRG